MPWLTNEFNVSSEMFAGPLILVKGYGWAWTQRTACTLQKSPHISFEHPHPTEVAYATVSNPCRLPPVLNLLSSWYGGGRPSSDVADHENSFIPFRDDMMSNDQVFRPSSCISIVHRNSSSNLQGLHVQSGNLTAIKLIAPDIRVPYIVAQLMHLMHGGQ